MSFKNLFELRHVLGGDLLGQSFDQSLDSHSGFDVVDHIHRFTELIEQIIIEQTDLLGSQLIKGIVSRLTDVLVSISDGFNCWQGFDHILNSLYSFEVGDLLLSVGELFEGIGVDLHLLCLVQRVISGASRFNGSLVVEGDVLRHGETVDRILHVVKCHACT